MASKPSCHQDVLSLTRRKFLFFCIDFSPEWRDNGLQYGTRHIMDSLRHRGAPIGCLLLCGGLAKSRLFITTVADATETPVVVPRQPESVLLGSAMLAACASRRFASLQDAVDAMGGAGLDVQPTSNGPDKR